MKVGEISRFIFKPQYAFYADNLEPRIPSHSTVLFEIQVIKMLPSNEFHSYFDLDREERMKFGLKRVMEIVTNEKKRANDYFVQQKYSRAINMYKECIEITDEHLSPDNLNTAEFKQLRIDLLNNIAKANLKLQAYTNALKYTDLVLNMDKCNLKAQLVKSMVLIKSGKLEEAKKFILKAQKMHPNNEQLKKCMLHYAVADQQSKKALNEFSKRMFQIEDSDINREQNVRDSFKATVHETINFFMQNESLDKHSIQLFDPLPHEMDFFKQKCEEATFYLGIGQEKDCVVATLYR